MCSVEEGTPFPEKAIKSLDELKCVKCKRDDVPVVVTRVNDAFCRDCFLVYAVHKFRSAIGKSKVILPREHVLVAYSGGPMSSALLHFIQQGIREEKLRFSITVLHISELCLVSLSEEDRKEKVTAVVEKMKGWGFPLLLSSLEQAMDIKGEGEDKEQTALCNEVTASKELSVTGSDLAADRLRETINALPSVSAREEFIRVLRSQLLVAIARQRGFSKVVVADTATSLSVRIMTDIAKGKGSQLSFDTTIGDKRYVDVTVVRPLRDLNQKEVEAYNRLHGIEWVNLPSIKDKWTTTNSIEQLTASFIKGLNDDFPSTVPNIVRTSAKLSEGESSDIRGQCVLCQSPLDTDVGEASALRAVEVSERLQNRGTAVVDVLQNPDPDSSASGVKGVRASMCYGCRLMTKDLKNAELLPRHVTSAAESHAASRAKMREQIAEYLIEEDSIDNS